MYDIEAKDVDAALENTEEERRRDTNSNDEKRTQFEEREKEIKVI